MLEDAPDDFVDPFLDEDAEYDPFQEFNFDPEDEDWENDR